MEKTCTGCVVSAGTHKPAEAVHNIKEPKPNALRLVQEYRKTMPSDVLHLWASDACDTLFCQYERIAELEALLAANQPAAQGMEKKLIDFIEASGDVRLSRCRIGSIKGHIRWDVEFGHDDSVRGKTLQEAITKALAAQAKQGE